MEAVETETLFRNARAAFGQGNLAEADRLCRIILGSNPNFDPAILLFAAVSAKSGRDDIALSHLNNLLRRNPGSAPGHITLSSLLFRMNQPEAAKLHGKQAINLSPNAPALRAAFIRDLATLELDQEAEAELADALEGSQDAAFLKGLAEHLAQNNLFKFASRAVESFLKLKSKNFGGWLLLGKLQSAQRKFELAAKSTLRALQLNEKSKEAHMLLGSTFSELGDFDQAAKHYEHAIELDPQESVGLSALGVIRQNQGKFDDAMGLLKQSVKARPTNGYAQFVLMRAKRATEEDRNRIINLEALANDQRVSKYDRLGLHSAIAKGWEDLREYEKAMGAYDAMNAAGYEIWLGGKSWDRKRDESAVNEQVRTFTAESIPTFQEEGINSRIPVFIVGMPRSGTSLVEQILSSHPEVAGAGELSFWPLNVHRAFLDGVLNVDELREVAGEYLELLAKFGPNASRVSDKMPQNYASLGSICSALPNAKVIHIRRNPIDTCLSIYTTPFGQGLAFTHRREDIVAAYREYLRVTSHWRTAFGPDQLLEVEYEQIVSNREAVSRQMIDFIGLPWDEACLRHEQNNRSVYTASVWQVRQPIYNSSVQRWLRFKPWIGEFIALGDSLNESP